MFKFSSSTCKVDHFESEISSLNLAQEPFNVGRMTPISCGGN